MKTCLLITGAGKELLEVDQVMILKNKDNRVPNERNNQYPFNCIGLLIFKKGENICYGTGFLISPNLVLTAAHNIFDLSNNQKLKNCQIYFYPGVSGLLQEHPKQAMVMVNQNCIKPDDVPVTVRPNLKGENPFKIDVENDFALLLLDKPIIRDHYILMGLNYPQLSQALVCGYPIDKQPNGGKVFMQFKANGKIITKTEQYIQHLVDTGKGQSGSPVLVELIKGAFFAVGIHVKGFILESGQAVNRASYLSTRNMETIKRWAVELIEENRQRFQEQYYYRSREYLEEILIVDFSKTENKVKPQPNLQVQLIIKSQRSISEIDRQIEEESNIHDYETIPNLVSMHCQAADIYIKENGFAEAYQRYQKCLQIILKEEQIIAKDKKQLDYNVEKGRVLNKLGALMQKQGQMSKAFNYYLQSYDLLMGKNVDCELVDVLCNLAFYHMEKSNHQKALEFYQKAYECVSNYESHNIKKLTGLLTNLANIKMHYNQVSQAHFIYNKALRMYEDLLEERIRLDRQELKQNGKTIMTIVKDSSNYIYFDLATCHYNLARCEFMRQKYYQGLQQFKLAFINFKASRVAPDDKFRELVVGFNRCMHQCFQPERRKFFLSYLQEILQIYKQDPDRLVMVLQIFENVKQEGYCSAMLDSQLQGST